VDEAGIIKQRNRTAVSTSRRTFRFIVFQTNADGDSFPQLDISLKVPQQILVN